MTSSGRCVHELVVEQAHRTPDRVAVASGDRTLTYAELDQRSDRLSHRLRASGVGPDVIVAVCLERSEHLPVALLGIFKAGGAYLPLDPAHPAPRTSYLLEDSGTGVAVTQADLVGTFAGRQVETVLVDVRSDPVAEPVAMPEPSLDDLAYVIYTSGSTGEPKGAMVEHGSLANVVEAMGELLAFGADDVVLAVSTLSFDIAAMDVFLPLAVGGRVVVLDDEEVQFGGRIATAAAASGATLLQGTPAMWRMLLQAGWEGTPGLRMISTGEALTPELAEALLSRGAGVWDAYSATEGGIYATVHRVVPGEASIPIGRPIPNVPVRILDEAGGPVAPGEVGEIHIAGAGPGRGYLGRPGLTADRFVPDPIAGRPGARMYRTGDRGRERADGEIEYLGRVDHQVKVRGYRVELGEVEAALRGHPAVHEAVALVRADGETLEAFVEPVAGAAPEGRELRRFLMDRLPSYMVPASVAVLDALPLTPTRKVDRQALRGSERLH